MRFKYFLSTVALVLLATLSGCVDIPDNEYSKYKDVKDSVYNIGDWRFQVTCIADDYYLYDRKTTNTIDINLKKYIDMSPFFYSISDTNNFTKLNYETAEIMQSSSIDEFDKFDQEIFKELLSSEKSVPYKLNKNIDTLPKSDKIPYSYIDQNQFIIYKINDNSDNISYELINTRTNKLIASIDRYLNEKSGFLYAISGNKYIKLNTSLDDTPLVISSNLNDFDEFTQKKFKEIDSNGIKLK